MSTDAVDPTRPIPPSDQPERLAALVDAVRARTAIVPRVGIVLGSGLGSLADEIEPTRCRSRSASCRAGRLPPRRVTSAGCCSGRLAGVPVAALQGRFHLYEGNDPGLVVQPVLLFRRLGATARDPDQRRRRRQPGLRRRAR